MGRNPAIIIIIIVIMIININIDININQKKNKNKNKTIPLKGQVMRRFLTTVIQLHPTHRPQGGVGAPNNSAAMGRNPAIIIIIIIVIIINNNTNINQKKIK